MPDHRKLVVLTEVRKAARVTLEQMARSCGLYGTKSRETVGAWERGQSVPHARHRVKFIDYLGTTLGLHTNPEQFHRIWQVLVEEWRWQPLSAAEWHAHLGDEQGAMEQAVMLTAPRFAANPTTLAAAEAVLRSLPADTIPDPASLPAGSRMPFSRNPLFVGREVDLRVLAASLAPLTTACSGPVTFIATTGLGGVGKTQLASEFVHRYGQFFAGGVFWLSFADESAVSSEVAACGGTDHLNLHPDFDTLPIDIRVRLVRAAWESSLPRLLVFDNCEDEALLDRWRPRSGGCRVLVTSRRAEWEAVLGVQTLPVEVLRREESIALLRQYRPDVPTVDAALAEIASELGDLPLALHVAGSYLARYRHVMTPAMYLEQLRRSPLLDHPSMQSMRFSPTAHSGNVQRTFELSYQRLDATSAVDLLAIALLSRAAYFAPGEPIPRLLLRETLNILPEDEDAVRQFEDAVARLVALGLLTCEADGALRLHRLVAAFVRAVSTDDRAQSAVEQALSAPERRFVTSEVSSTALLPLPHLRAVTDRAVSRTDQRAAELCYMLSLHLEYIEDYPRAQDYAQRALDIMTTLYDPKHVALTDYLDQMGWLQDCQGDSVGAEQFYERALAICAAALGTDHLATAHKLNRMGMVRHAQGDYAAARLYYEQSLDIRRQHLGETHPDLASILNNLGLLLTFQGHYAEAHPYHQQALAIWESTLGPSHPQVAFSLNNLGYLLRAQGRYAEAWTSLERALAIRERIFGPVNSLIAVTLNHLGRVRHAQGDYAEAERYLRQALDMRTQTLGLDHPDTAHSLGNWGMLLSDQGNDAAARTYLQRALDIHLHTMGLQHRHTARSLNHLGLVQLRQGEVTVAHATLEQALRIREQVLGTDHPNTANSVGHLGTLLSERGNVAGAKPLLERALIIHQQTLGDRHPYTARSLMQMGLLHQRASDPTAARMALWQAVMLYEDLLGHNHPYTSTCRRHLETV